ncbi:integrin beta-1-binding protein 1-like [Styela clava]|uniref:integrin beta-1-binding protein 1-like n=1 Tax=Styela clava TaxID=7725 RepID=UPI00193A023B|nr:integrin beta-1-binding protein 1-like [Styela clava]
MFRRQTKIARLSGDDSEQSLSQGSSKSKSHSLDSSEDLSKSSSLSSPEAGSKRAGSISSAVSSVVLSDGNETDFPVRIVGCLENVSGAGCGPLDVINLIDIAQQENELPFVATNEEAVISLTVHGIKLTKASNSTVLYRIPLHKIERIVIFDDGLIGNTMLAVKCARDFENSNKEAMFNIHAYQCESKELAQEVCRSFSHILDTAIGATFPGKTVQSVT